MNYKNIKSLLFLLVMPFGLMPLGCTVPQYLWPQKDMALYEVNKAAVATKILIASRQSEFKNAVIEKIKTYYENQTIYIKVTGVDSLENEDVSKYSAIILINTAMAWTLDRKVEAFLDKNSDLESIIVLTTSGDGDVLPDMEGRKIDAMACASYPEKIAPVADEIIIKINNLLK